MKLDWKELAARVAGVACSLVLLAAPHVSAQQSSSTNYQVNEVFFGSGGELEACGTTYCAKQSAGEIAAGHAAGTLFQTQAGFNTDRIPYIAFSVDATNTHIGSLSEFGTATAEATFAVKTYLASGYVVRIESDSPVSDGIAHQLSPLATPSSPNPGTEQFGMNLVANTDPVVFGDDPVQVPDNTFSFGTVATGYNTPDLYKYVKGDIIASSNRSSGQTDYTISFIYDISNVTPEGLYTYNGVLVATSTY